MLQPEKVRTVEVQQADGSWIRADYGQLEAGDVVRMFEPDGRPVYDGKMMRLTAMPSFQFEAA